MEKKASHYIANFAQTLIVRQERPVGVLCSGKLSLAILTVAKIRKTPLAFKKLHLA
jgi:hypothetical protein